MKISHIVFLLSIFGLAVTQDYHPLSDEYIADINQRQSTWTAGRNFNANTPMWRLKLLASGVKGRSRTNKFFETVVHNDTEEIPESFDARDYWSNCESIGLIQDQSVCGSCWAFGAVTAMSDRICIASDGEIQVLVSAQDLLTCCNYCAFGCSGGFLLDAWEYWQAPGITTGGLYERTDQGCKSYYLQSCDHYITGSKIACDDIPSLVTAPDCVKQCDDSSIDYNSTLTYGSAPYAVKNDEKQIQLEILKNGPVETSFNVYEDFLQYKTGVYQNTSSQFIGIHAVKILGWGVENEVPYWLVANSWNSEWGNNGFFKMVRGSNNCDFEANVVAGLPDLDRIKHR